MVNQRSLRFYEGLQTKREKKKKKIEAEYNESQMNGGPTENVKL